MSFDPDGVLAGPEPPRMYKKTAQAIELIVNHGVKPRDALLLARGGNPPSATAVKDIRRKAAKYSLTRPAMVKLAHNVVQNTLTGQVQSYTTQKLDKNGQVVDIVEVIAPTVTNQLAAAAMVFDRAEPITRQNINLTGELKDFMPIRLDDYA